MASDERNEVSLITYLDRRLEDQHRIVCEMIAALRHRQIRTEDDLREFVLRYEQAHEDLRKDVIATAALERSNMAVTSDRRWLVATSISTILLLLGVIAFIVDHATQ